MRDQVERFTSVAMAELAEYSNLWEVVQSLFEIRKAFLKGFRIIGVMHLTNLPKEGLRRAK